MTQAGRDERRSYQWLVESIPREDEVDTERD